MLVAPFEPSGATAPNICVVDDAGLEPPAALGACGESAPKTWVLRGGLESFDEGPVPNICVELLGLAPAGLGEPGAIAPNIWVDDAGRDEGLSGTGPPEPGAPNIIVWLVGVLALFSACGGIAVKTC